MPRCSVVSPASVRTTTRSSLCGWTKSMTVASPRDPSTRSVISKCGCTMLHRTAAGRAGREPQVGLQPLVDAGRPGPFLRAGVDQFRLAAGPPAQRAVGVQPVAAEVHQRAAGEVERPARVAVVRLGHRDQRVDALQLAQLAGVEEREQPLHHRVEQVVEPLHHRDARLLRGVADLRGLLRGGGERLLREHVLARRRPRRGSTDRGTRSAAGCRPPPPRGRPALRRRSRSPARRRARRRRPRRASGRGPQPSRAGCRWRAPA